MRTSPQTARRAEQEKVAQAHKNALELEEKKWSYRRTEIQYLEAGQHLRSLNQLMWQIPSMAIAIVGGLWYGTTLVEHTKVRGSLFTFAIIVAVATIFMIIRIRAIIGDRIREQQTFTQEPVKEEGCIKVIHCWIAILLGSSILSLLAIYNDSLLSKKTDASKAAATTCQVDVTLQTTPSDASKIKKSGSCQ